MNESPVDTALVAEWLALPTLDEQMAYLQTADLLNSTGLSQLVVFAASLVRRDPGLAQRLTAVTRFPDPS